VEGGANDHSLRGDSVELLLIFWPVDVRENRARCYLVWSVCSQLTAQWLLVGDAKKQKFARSHQLDVEAED
jgi:hypothetical protein